ncbi:MAG: hypothetical protein HW418_4064 [Anaerolineales bacterium]|nr:hypothetical protein [Anaerolineales bacterium]
MSMEYGRESTRRRTYTILTGIILLTLPCYCAGFIALALAPQPGAATLPPLTATAAALLSPAPTGIGSATVLIPTVTSLVPLTPLPTFTPGPRPGHRHLPVHADSVHPAHPHTHADGHLHPDADRDKDTDHDDDRNRKRHADGDSDRDCHDHGTAHFDANPDPNGYAAAAGDADRH